MTIYVPLPGPHCSSYWKASFLCHYIFSLISDLFFELWLDIWLSLSSTYYTISYWWSETCWIVFGIWYYFLFFPYFLRADGLNDSFSDFSPSCTINKLACINMILYDILLFWPRASRVPTCLCCLYGTTFIYRHQIMLLPAQLLRVIFFLIFKV